jgi:hypothetical protein
VLHTAHDHYYINKYTSLLPLVIKLSALHMLLCMHMLLLLLLLVDDLAIDRWG